MFTVSKLLNFGRCPRVQKDQSLQDAFCLMSKHRLTQIPVVDEGQRVVATVDLFQVVRYLLQFVPEKQPIPDSCYQDTVTTIHESEPLYNAAYFPVDRVVVTPSGKLRGVLTRAEVIRALMREIEVLRFAMDQVNLGFAVFSTTGDLIYANQLFHRMVDPDGTRPGGVPLAHLVSSIPTPENMKDSPTRHLYRWNGYYYSLEYYPIKPGTRLLGVLLKVSVEPEEAREETCAPLEPHAPSDAAREVHEVFHDVVIKSAAMKQVLDLALKAARTSSSVLLTGETGVGKEVVAEIIHRLGTRSSQPLVKLNCAAIPDTLLEAELFGYQRGAFTGAAREGKTGLIEEASGGTLFLDEITELPLRLQAKLLRFLEHGEYYKIGGTKPHRVDVRIIAATNRDIRSLIEQQAFREDLYYRLCVIPIHIPPLREREEDIVPLALHFLRKFSQMYNVTKKFSPAALSVLQRYHWPGNVRELQHLVERLVIITEGPVIEEQSLPAALTQRARPAEKIQIVVRELLPLKEAYQILEQKLLQHALRTFGSAREIAKELGVDHSTILRKINRYKAIKTLEGHSPRG